jgi:inhibitor of cysteine peptidase
MRRATGWILTILVAGCGGEELAGPGVDFEELRAAGKADGYVDKTLSCEGSCGSLATDGTSYCGCDKLCTKYNDCCGNKAAVCDAKPGKVIVIAESMNGTTQSMKLGETIDVQLAGNPTTGYAWQLLTSSKSFPLQKQEYVPNKPQLLGSGGVYHFYFTADSFAVGKVFTLSFAYYRSWEGAASAIKTFTVKISVLSSTTKGCAQINQDYQKEVTTAAACKADADCDRYVGGSLTCGFPTKSINSDLSTKVEALKLEWQSAKCDALDWNCPMMSPLPPWMSVRSVCLKGACQVEYFDTRAKEGEACGDDIDKTCVDGLYCAFGLNWCGTPPVTGVCRKLGDCGAVSDCENPDNSWAHPMCVGKATCAQGHCGWKCGP